MTGTTSNIALRIERLAVGYGKGKRRHIVAKGLSASLPVGQLTLLAGRNGIGKSTLLRTIAALLPPAEGTVSMGSTLLHELPPSALARRVSVVLTERIEVEGLTARELVETGRLPYTGFAAALSQRDRHVVEEAMEMTDTLRLARRRTDRLSDGERQRVMVAKALAQETPVILLDEPTAFLDYPGKAEIIRLLKRLAAEREKAILVSSHDLSIALPEAGHMWLMTPEGITEGLPKELVRQGALHDLCGHLSENGANMTSILTAL